MVATRIVSQDEGTDDFDIAGTVVGGFGMVDADFSRDQKPDNDFVALIVAANPSTDEVWLRVNSDKDENVEDLANAANWDAWANFGVPDGGAGAQIMSVSVSISHDGQGAADTYAAMIMARMDDGTLYIRSTLSDVESRDDLDDPTAAVAWGAWVGFYRSRILII